MAVFNSLTGSLWWQDEFAGDGMPPRVDDERLQRIADITAAVGCARCSGYDQAVAAIICELIDRRNGVL